MYHAFHTLECYLHASYLQHVTVCSRIAWLRQQFVYRSRVYEQHDTVPYTRTPLCEHQVSRSSYSDHTAAFGTMVFYLLFSQEPS